MDQCRELGADHVLDYKREGMSQFQDRFDLILAVNGYNSIWKYKRALKVDGRYVLVGGAMTQFFQTFLLGGLISSVSTRKMSHFLSVPNRESLDFLAKLLEEKQLKPVIGARYRFAEIGEAFRDLESGHAKGKIVITF
jgi:NADPH:quinone reductase-like Zn-dependent oxidoreductase